MERRRSGEEERGEEESGKEERTREGVEERRSRGEEE